MTEEHKRKIGISNKGKLKGKKRPPNVVEKIRKSRWWGEKNTSWKGDEVGYGALHDCVKNATKPMI